MNGGITRIFASGEFENGMPYAKVRKLFSVAALTTKSDEPWEGYSPD